MEEIYFGCDEEMECPRCHSRDLEYLHDSGEINYYQSNWEIYECQKCKIQFKGYWPWFWELDSYW